MVYFILDVVSQLDLRAITDDIHRKDARGTQPYAPQMMVALLLYGYCVGVYSSRRLERATYEDVGFRVLAGGQESKDSTGEEELQDSRERMLAKLQTEDGRKIYKRRKAVVEPIFGQAKEARGFRRFLLRGLRAAGAEWSLVCTASNLLKLYRTSLCTIG